MPTSHAAARHGVSWGKARRAEKAFLAEWDDSGSPCRSGLVGAPPPQAPKTHSAVAPVATSIPRIV